MKWAIELLEIEVSFEASKTLKARLLADYFAKMTHAPLEPNLT